MPNPLPGGWTTPSASSLLARLLARRTRHPAEFDCAVRVVAGTVPGESARWRYRRTTVDPMPFGDEVVGLNHGRSARLRVRFTAEQRTGGPTLRAHHVIWPATEVRTGARIEVAADAGEAGRLGIG